MLEVKLGSERPSNLSGGVAWAKGVAAGGGACAVGGEALRCGYTNGWDPS